MPNALQPLPVHTQPKNDYNKLGNDVTECGGKTRQQLGETTKLTSCQQESESTATKT